MILGSMALCHQDMMYTQYSIMVYQQLVNHMLARIFTTAENYCCPAYECSHVSGWKTRFKQPTGARTKD